MSMLEWIDGFPSQLVKAVEIARQANIKRLDGIQNIVITGLGGSGIGGTLSVGLAYEQSTIPVSVSKSYQLPAWVDQHTLVIACSYSGNTEETISAFTIALQKGAPLVCITSGGQLAELGEKAGAQVIRIPGGFPPRTCLGFSWVQVMKVLEAHGCISQGIEGEVLSAARWIEKQKEELQKLAHQLTDFFHGRFPILYANDPYAGVVERWKQQINENSKMLCHFHVLPEMNHNEMVGWRDGNEHTSVLFLKAADDDARNLKRMDICAEIIRGYTRHVELVEMKGSSRMERLMYGLYLGDWVSLYLSEKRSMDPVEVTVIDHLKAKLAEK